jgi:N-acetylglutamate synthase-like GNAT family acetyltransferase
MKNMQYSLIIRRACKEDAPAIYSILQRAFQEYSEVTGVKNLEALSETVDDIRKEILNKTVFIAVADDKVIGTLKLDIKGDQAYLSRFAVDSENRHFGIGKALMSVADRYLKSVNVKRIILHTASKHKTLMSFYYCIGFYVEAIETDRGYLRARMVKELL